MDLEQSAADGLVGIELKFRCYSQKMYSQGLRCYGSPIELIGFLSHFKKLVKSRVHYSPLSCEALVSDSTMDEGAIIFSNGRVLRFLAIDSSDDFRVDSIDSEFAAGWEAEAAADLNSIRANMKPVEGFDANESLIKISSAIKCLNVAGGK